MTGNNVNDHERSYSVDVAAYALGVLEPAEAGAFRRHLETCAVCRNELDSFQVVVDALATSPPRHDAPLSLRRQVRQALRDESSPERRAPVARRRAPMAAWSRPTMALASALAMVVVIAALAFALTSGGGPSTRVIRAQVTGPGRASLRVSDGHGELAVQGLPAPPRGKIYEVWVRHGTGPPAPTSALFGVTAHGAADVDVPGSLHGVSQVMVTPEPAGGSRVPTHAPVISAALT